jgi:hypothetical protein
MTAVTGLQFFKYQVLIVMSVYQERERETKGLVPDGLVSDVTGKVIRGL